MIDEIFDRNYQDGRAALNDGIDRLAAAAVAELSKVTTSIHRIQWSAPWAPKPSGKSLHKV